MSFSSHRKRLALVKNVATAEGLIHNLRPPDREPPRLASLTAEQEVVIVLFLEEVAFNEDSANSDFAMQVLEEWWLPNALYRER
ncbi:MAG: DUF6714 family protein [Methylobacter sp.]